MTADSNGRLPSSPPRPWFSSPACARGPRACPRARRAPSAPAGPSSRRHRLPPRAEVQVAPRGLSRPSSTAPSPGIASGRSQRSSRPILRNEIFALPRRASSSGICPQAERLDWLLDQLPGSMRLGLPELSSPSRGCHHHPSSPGGGAAGRIPIGKSGSSCRPPKRPGSRWCRSSISSGIRSISSTTRLSAISTNCGLPMATRWRKANLPPSSPHPGDRREVAARRGAVLHRGRRSRRPRWDPITSASIPAAARRSRGPARRGILPATCSSCNCSRRRRISGWASGPTARPASRCHPPPPPGIAAYDWYYPSADCPAIRN